MEKLLRVRGARILPVNVDKDGLITDEVIIHLRSGKKIRAIYTTPHHQYPTTVTLSLQRRLELIHLSNKYGFSIIEDDYDNEFHFLVTVRFYLYPVIQNLKTMYI